MSKLSVIVINWNARQLLERCLRSVFASASESQLQMEVLVVDNGSRDGSAEMVRALFPDVTLLAYRENLGFARAVNRAMERVSGEYLLVLNPDTEMVGSAIPRMLEFAERHPEVAVVGPQLLNPDGTVQSSRRRFPTPATAFLESTVLQRWFSSHPALRSFYMLDRDDYHVQEVDWVVGAAFLVRVGAVGSVGPMDEGYFMYSEELDWCRRFVNAGWKVVYLPDAQVVHHGSQSADQDLLHRHTRFQHSKARYFEKYHGPALAQLVRIAILASYLFLLAEDVAKLLILRRKRPMRRARIGLLARVVAWCARWAATAGRTAP